MSWETKANLRARIDSVERYNSYLQEEIRRQHGKVMQLRKAMENTFTNIDLNEKKLFLAVHDMRRDEDSSFALGWNQAVGHVERLISDLLRVDLKSATEELG